jgi:phosphoheptose isomerase
MKVTELEAVVANHFAVSAEVFAKLALDPDLITNAATAGRVIDVAFIRGKRLYIAGNGGSAADAQHFAAELVGYFGSHTDKPLPAQSLTTDTSFLTAWGNDEEFENIFVRQLQAFGRPGDVFFGISTSGSSEDILRALVMANSLDMTTIALVGDKDTVARKKAGIALCVPSGETPFIQEMHIAVIHAICKCITR